MKTKKPQQGNPSFEHNKLFGPSVPLIEPEINIFSKVSCSSGSLVLHTNTRITGVYGGAEFAYNQEENIEIEETASQVSADDLLNEIKNSATRVFRNAYDDSVHHSLPFPFARITPSIEVEHLRTQVQQELEQCKG